MLEVAPANQKDEVGNPAKDLNDASERIRRELENERARHAATALRCAKMRTWLAMTRGCSEDEIDRQIAKMLA